MSTECTRDIEVLVAECVQERDDGYQRCAQRQTQREQRCTQTATTTRQECTQWENQRTQRCSNWGIFSFVCVAWVWVTTRVCRAYATIRETVCRAYAWVERTVCVAVEWVSHIVCIAWEYTTVAMCLVVEIIATVVRVVIEVIEATILFMLDLVASIFTLIFAIPVIGRLLDIAWNAVTELFWRPGSILVETVLEIFGRRPEKLLRVCVHMPNQLAFNVVDPATGLTNLQAAIDQLQEAKDIYRREANIRLVPAVRDRHLFRFRTAFSADEPVDRTWIHVVDYPPELLDVTCNWDAFVDSLGLEGSRFAFQGAQCLRGNMRKLAGYGPSVRVFFVRSHAAARGCALSGWLTDYATVNVEGAATTPLPDTAAHEIGHTCSLWHTNDPPLLMTTPNRTNSLLRGWQSVIVRSSKFVTYF